MLKLMNALKVPNVPGSWHQLKTIVSKTENKEQKQELIKSTLFFCQECEQQSSNSKKCTNTSCSNNRTGLVSLHSLLLLNIRPQLEQVLKSIEKDDLNLTFASNSNRSSEMFDIQHGAMYRNVVYALRNQSKKLFITFTCNIDGAALYTSSEQSMWTFTACINELRRSIRFNMENMIGE